MSKGRLVCLGLAALAVIAGSLWYTSARTTTPNRERASATAAATPATAAAASTDPDAPVPATIAGTVRAATPLSGPAFVLAEPVGDDGAARPAGGDELTCTTDAHGAFSFEGLAPGRYRLVASAADRAPSEPVVLEVAPGERRAELELLLGETAPTLSGIVSDVIGGPIAGALLELTPLHGARSLAEAQLIGVRTDADGRYRVAVARGRYRVRASHPAYVPHVDRLAIGDRARTYDLSLAPGSVIEGRVISAAGDGVPAAWVHYSSEPLERLGGRPFGRGLGNALRTDGEGRFVLRGLPTGPISLTAQGPGGAVREPLELSLGIAETVTDVTLVLEQGYRITGKVIERSAPRFASDLGSVTVRAISPTGSATARAAADGTFAFRGLAPGRYRLSASGPFHLEAGFGTSVDLASGDLADVALEVIRGARITGRVEPATVAEVSIDLLPPKQLGQGHDGDDATPAGVTDHVGAAASGPPMGLGAMRLLGPGASVRTSRDGSFELGPVPPGTLHLVAKDSDGRSGRATVEVTAAGAAGVVITLDAKRTISGTVRDTSGNPIANAVVAIKPAATQHKQVTMIINGRDVGAHHAPSADDGSFRMSGLEPDVYELSVRDPHGQSLELVVGARKRADRERVDLAKADVTGKSLTVDPLDGVLRGVVLDPDGSPAEDAWVTASATPRAGVGPFGERLPPGARGGPPAPSEAAQEAGGEAHETRSHMVMVTDDIDDDGGGFGGGLGGSLPPVLTDERGRFEIRNLQRGSYDLVAQDARATARAFARGALTGGESELAVVSLTRLEGAVTLDGQAVPGFTVTVQGPVNRRVPIRDDRGHYSIARLDPGRYQVHISSADGDGHASVEVTAGRVATADFALTRLVPVSGTLKDRSGQPLVGAMVVLGAGEPGRLSISIDDDDTPARTDASGRFRVQALPGKHMLVALDEESPGPRLVHPFELGDELSKDLGTLTAN